MNPTFDPSQLPLRDIHLPDPVGWWPPAPGWWIAALLVLGLAAVGLLRWRWSRARRTALRAMKRIIGELQRGDDPATCVQGLSQVLRRFAMTTAEEPSKVAGLTSERWLDYLDRRWHGRAGDARFAAAGGQQLLDAPYRRPHAVTREQALALGSLCRDWIRAQPLRRG